MGLARERMLRHVAETTLRMANEWHDESDHARDGTPFGGPLCNCDRIAARAFHLGWSPDYEKRDRQWKAFNELREMDI